MYKHQQSPVELLRITLSVLTFILDSLFGFGSGGSGNKRAATTSHPIITGTHPQLLTGHLKLSPGYVIISLSICTILGAPPPPFFSMTRRPTTRTRVTGQFAYHSHDACISTLCSSASNHLSHLIYAPMVRKVVGRLIFALILICQPAADCRARRPREQLMTE